MPRGNNVISFCLISNPFYTDHIESIIYHSNRLIMLNHMESITLINETAFDHLPLVTCCVDCKHNVRVMHRLPLRIYISPSQNVENSSQKLARMRDT